ncbi:helix-turn-helix domain-containing protein [Streptomyces tubercidicus]
MHRWTDIAELTGEIVLFVPTAPQPSARHPLSGAATAASWTAPAPSWRLVTAARTLSRAAHAATGRSAKSHINERLLLEAKRLLAHDRLTATRCAERLGFTDASNFSAFFLRETGQRPGAWQATQP